VPEHIVAQNMRRVPAALPFAQAALIEPLACALHGVRDAEIQLGDTVAIIGAGAQGLMQVQLARARGAGQVIVIGRAHGRLARARQLGAQITISALNDNPIARVRELHIPSRIILITAYSSPELYAAAQKLRIDHYLTKPVPITLLRSSATDTLDAVSAPLTGNTC